MFGTAGTTNLRIPNSSRMNSPETTTKDTLVLSNALILMSVQRTMEAATRFVSTSQGHPCAGVGPATPWLRMASLALTKMSAP